MIDYLGEFIGTFIFISIILFIGKPVYIALTLLAIIYFSTIITKSKGSINPAVSLSLFINGNISGFKFIGYVVAEVVAAILAVLLFKYMTLNENSI